MKHLDQFLCLEVLTIPPHPNQKNQSMIYPPEEVTFLIWGELKTTALPFYWGMGGGVSICLFLGESPDVESYFTTPALFLFPSVLWSERENSFVRFLPWQSLAVC